MPHSGSIDRVAVTGLLLVLLIPLMISKIILKKIVIYLKWHLINCHIGFDTLTV